MKALYEEIKNCSKCADMLYCNKTQMPPAIMLDNINTATLIFVAQNPGMPLKHEIGNRYESILMQSKMGELFINKFLQASKLSYEDIYWANLCKCPSLNNTIPTVECFNNCFNYLLQQVRLITSANHLILLGNVVKNYFTYSITNLFPEYLITINFFHPSYIYRTGNYKLIQDLCNKIK